MATDDNQDLAPADEAPDGPDAAGAIVPPRNPEDGTPMAPKADPGSEPHMTDEAAEAIETPVEAGDEVPQP
ncbi:MAG TPA: hypothetical protein VHJ78_07795 [Actinomycetota bacterium]|nr:hypothetical protein [Actinomycetota bacterium]